MTGNDGMLFKAERWHDAAAYDDGWRVRVEWMAGCLPEGIRSVADFGCGKRVLAQLLPAGCSYIGIDSHKGMGADIQLDLNRLTVSDVLPEADAAFMSGVIEYLTDFPFLLGKFTYQTIIAHYAYVLPPKTLRCPLRRSRGWVNDYTLPELLLLFESAGYRLDIALSSCSKHEILLRLVKEAAF